MYIWKEKKNGKNKVIEIEKKVIRKWWIYFDGKSTLKRFGFDKPSSGLKYVKKCYLNSDGYPDEDLLKPKRFNVDFPLK